MNVLVSGVGVPLKLAEYCKQRAIAVQHLETVPSPAQLRRLVLNVDFYLLGGDERLSSEVLAAAPALKAISFLGAGAGTFVDLDAASERSVQVLTTPGVNSTAVAEFAMGQAIGLMRGILRGVHHPGQASRGSTDLANSTVGIVGLGASGTALARMLRRGLSCEVLYHSRSPNPEVEAELDIAAVSLEEMFSRCVTVFLCCSLTGSTRGLIDGRLLSADSAARYLVCTADPRVMDPAAVAEALESGQLRGVAIDGYYEAPVPMVSEDQHGLLRYQSESVFITGHIAAASVGAWRRMEDMAVNNLISVMNATLPDGANR